ncbi:hypothetical protein BSF40_04830 [Pseudomonas sp. ACN5]|nr:hypothetical protein BSF40_04830 [Pseudomonas sp. ACN5]
MAALASTAWEGIPNPEYPIRSSQPYCMCMPEMHQSQQQAKRMGL